MIRRANVPIGAGARHVALNALALLSFGRVASVLVALRRAVYGAVWGGVLLFAARTSVRRRIGIDLRRYVDRRSRLDLFRVIRTVTSCDDETQDAECNCDFHKIYSLAVLDRSGVSHVEPVAAQFVGQIEPVFCRSIWQPAADKVAAARIINVIFASLWSWLAPGRMSPNHEAATWFPISIPQRNRA